MNTIKSVSKAKQVAFFLGPLAFGLLLLWGGDSDLKKVLACAAWMMIWWIAEVVPIYITAMLPMVLFPTLGILGTKETFAPYASPIVFLFMGGFIIALAMEKYRLHLRFALKIISVTGTKPRQIILGFMISTAFLSMWISNTATTVMMLPMALSVIDLLKRQSNEPKTLQNFGLALLLSIAYAANIGGIMSLIGTPPNVVFAGLIEERYAIEVGFGNWMLIGVPTGIILLSAAYFLLTLVVIKISSINIEGANKLIEEQTQSIGKIGVNEKKVLYIFLLTAFLWTFKGNLNALVGFGMLSNTSIAMLGGLLMFLTPTNLGEGMFILHWKDTEKLPWGILILFGGGLSLAASFEAVGLIDAIGQFVSENLNFSVFALCIGLTFLSIFATEVMSNVALVTVLLPVVMGISEGMGVSSYAFTIPVTMAASCAFMMPISTPPNAIVYSSGLIEVKDMIKVGIILNVVSLLVLSILLPFLVDLIF